MWRPRAALTGGDRAPPGPGRPIRRGTLLALGLVFLLARGLLVVTAADRLSEPDLAEVKLMAIGDAWIDEGTRPSLPSLLSAARAGSSSPHGGFLPVSLAYAALAVPGGEPGRYGLLKTTVLLLGTLSFLSWVAVASRLGGAAAAWAMAALLLAPPPSMLGASLVAWGSHPEAAALLGPAFWLALVGRGPRGAALLGATLGLSTGFSLLLAPVAAALGVGWAWDAFWEDPPRPWARRILAGLGAALLVAGGLLWISHAGGASVTESAGSAPLDLLHEARADVDPLVRDTAAALLPPRIVGLAGPGPAGAHHGEDRALGVLLLLALAMLLPGVLRDRDRRGRVLAALVAAPLLAGAVLATLGPRRPFLPPRYLLGLWPWALLALALAVGRAPRRWRPLAVVGVMLWLVPGLTTQGDLLRPGRAPGFLSYSPERYVAAEIGHVSYDEAPAVNAFLDRRDAKDHPPLGFGLAAGVGGGEALLLDGRPPHQVDPAALLARLDALLARRPDLALDRVHRNLGWGLAVFAPEGRGVWLSVLERLGPGRGEAAFGLGQGLRSTARGCAALRWILGPDRARVLEGARSLGGEGLPPCPGL